LGSTCSERLLAYCLRGPLSTDEPWPSDLLEHAIQEDEGRALLSVVVERLGDLFEPRLCDVYENLFAEVITRVAPDLRQRIRRGPSKAVAPQSADRIYVLSRVTLGADVAVTSVLLDAAKRRYPDARVVFLGPRKSYEMFQGDPRIEHREVPYARGGTLNERLRSSADLWIAEGIVIDPDSRLSQLGLISICDEERYFHFPSRAYGDDGGERLPDLASRWAREIFGIADARPYVTPAIVTKGEPSDITVSLGVAENPAKRLGDEFEMELVRTLGTTGRRILIDKGGSAEERVRVERLAMPGVSLHDGSFASFAAEIARSKRFVGYDSAGGHVASACGVPVISIFKGAVSERFLARWRPLGTVIRGECENPIAAVREAIQR
jgi:glycosyl transferase family 9 (putative heptosyltransferase)